MAYLQEEGLKQVFEEVKKQVNSAKSSVTSDFSSHTSNKNNPHGVTKEQVGYKAASAAVKPEIVVDDEGHISVKVTTTDAFGGKVSGTTDIPNAVGGVSDGLFSKEESAKLAALKMNSEGVIDASNLPSYVDDVIEGVLYTDGKFYNYTTSTTGNKKEIIVSDVIKGEPGKIYVDTTTEDGKCYRYTAGGKYVPVSDVPAETLKEIAQLQTDTAKNKADIETTNGKLTSYNERITNNSTDISHLKESSQPLISTSWKNLKDLRDAGNLVPGRQYRIVDYQCTTVQENTQSAGHQFDIIVTADSADNLNEEARAVRHNRDEGLSDAVSTTTNGTTTKSAYFAGSKLEAWKIWYCLDNDTDRFAWADATNGKGVIYRMIDEFNNDCPYDFKNIQFKRWQVTNAKQSELIGKYLALQYGSNNGITGGNTSNYFYTFTLVQGVNVDASLLGILKGDSYVQNNGCFLNNIKGAIDMKGVFKLNNIVFINEYSTTPSQTKYFACYSNTFGSYCESNTFGSSCNSNTFGSYCYSNTFGSYCESNTFGSTCYSNTFGSSCYSNTFGSSCNSNTFGSYCYSNTFGSYCYSNTFGSYCYSNTFGSSCYYNKLGGGNSNNTLDAYFQYNKFENGVQYVEFSGVGTSSKYVQNYHIKQGMTFTSSNKHTITAKPGLEYETSVAKKSDGTVVEYCEADLLNSISSAKVQEIANTVNSEAK